MRALRSIRYRRELALGCLVSLAVHATLGVRSLTVLDRLFLPDDTYYTLTIARNIARGIGPSADGILLTSGFQPLLAFFLVPSFLFELDQQVPVYLAIFLGGVCGVVNTGLIGCWVAARTHSPGTTLAATLFAACAPVLVKNDLNGLETSLATALALCCVLAAGQARRTGALRWAAVTGCCAGLAMLARVDNAFVVGLVGLWCARGLPPRATGVLVGSALGCVLPWWGYALLTFGTVVPESGPAVRQIVAFHQSLHLTTAAAVHKAITALGRLVGASGGLPAKMIAGGILLAMADPLRRSLRAKRVDETTLLGVAGIAFLLFYTFYLPAFWFFERYFYFVYVCAIGCAAAALCRVGRALRGFAYGRMVAAAVAGGLILANVLSLIPLRSSPAGTLFAGDEGARGYGEVAREVLGWVPSGATVSAMQSGALGYYAPRSIRVLNLDGVVNRDARRALGERGLYAYLASSGVDYFADWDINVLMLLMHSGAPEPRAILSPLRRMKPQGRDRFTLFRVH